MQGSAPILEPTPRRRSRRKALWISLLIALFVGPMAAYFGGGMWYIHQKRQFLLDPANAPALQQACEEIWRNQDKYRPDPKWHPVSGEKLDPTDPLMPAIIRVLKPGDIIVTQNSVRLHVGGVFVGTCGVEACFVNTQTQPYVPFAPRRQLLPNLSYFEL